MPPDEAVDRVPTLPARRARRPVVPSNVYRPSSSRFGQGARTWPRARPTTARLAPKPSSTAAPSTPCTNAASRRPRSRRRLIAARDLVLLARRRRAIVATSPWSRVLGTDSAIALAISVRWVNACGMFPISRWFTWSYSSENSPRSFRNAEQPLEQLLAPPSAAPDHREVDHEPEAAREERALARRQAVGRALVRDVAHHEPVLHELALRPPRRCRSTRGSSGGRNPTCGISSSEASSCFDP